MSLTKAPNDAHNEALNNAHNEALNDAHNEALNDAHNEAPIDAHNETPQRRSQRSIKNIIKNVFRLQNYNLF